MRTLTFSSLLFLSINTHQLPGYIGNGSPFLDAINSQFLLILGVQSPRSDLLGHSPARISDLGLAARNFRQAETGFYFDGVILDLRISDQPFRAPESTTLALMGLGLAGIGWRRKTSSS